MAPTSPASRSTLRRAVEVHRHFHGRGSRWALAIGLMVNLGGLSALIKIALDA